MPDPKLQFTIDNLQENLEVEAKNWMNGLQSNSDKAKLAKEIIALANHGGGYIFIGFNDDEPELTEIQPSDQELSAFSQDTIAGIVQRYITPPCQCRVEMITKSGSDIVHPVIVVPGEHRTPVWAKAGSPDNNATLRPNTVYIRRPGGSSEPPQTQDDWEKLIERLVRARQSEMLSAFREILNPSSRILSEEQSSIEDWHAESYAAWQQVINEFEEDDPRRLTQGHWTISFAIQPFTTESLGQLNTFLDQEIPKYSGWPPFTYLHRDPVRPQAQGNSITAYLGRLREEEQPIHRADHCDFWRVTRDGQGFMLRPMQEDRAGYPGQVYPMPEGPFFDWVLPVYRMTEVLKFIETLGTHFSEEDARFELMVTYYNTNGRKLEQAGMRYNLMEGAVCHVDQLESRISAPVSDISTNLEELIFSLLIPIYEQFEFTELPRQLITNVVADVLSYRR